MRVVDGVETKSRHPNYKRSWVAAVGRESFRACRRDVEENKFSKAAGSGQEGARNGWHEMHLRPAGFDEIVISHLPLLFDLAKYRTDTVEDAQDLVQDTLVKAFGAMDQFKPGSNLRGWLVTILLNTFRDRLRRANHHPPMVSADEVDDLDPRLGKAQARNQGYWQNPEVVGVQRDLVRQAHNAIDQLPSPFRQVMRMAAIDGYTYQEIAERVECPIGTVMSRLSRGRRLLRKALMNLIDV